MSIATPIGITTYSQAGDRVAKIARAVTTSAAARASAPTGQGNVTTLLAGS